MGVDADHVSDLSELLEPLKRTVAVPGTFGDVFPDTTDDDLLGSLLDGFSEAQLDGYFVAPLVLITDDGVTAPDIARAQGALVVLYSATRIVQTQLLNLKTRVRYEAKGLVYEAEQSAQVLVALLKDLQARKAALADAKGVSGAGSAFVMADQYLAREMGIELGLFDMVP